MSEQTSRNLFEFKNKNLSNLFPNKMVADYIDGLTHSDQCTRTNRQYTRGDKRIAKVELPDKKKRYYIYTCKSCGGQYYSEEDMDTIHYFERK